MSTTPAAPPLATLCSAQVSTPDSAAAGAELVRKLAPTARDLALCFVGPGHDLDALAQALATASPGTQWIGCTTAGEFGPEGCTHGALVGLALKQPDFCSTTLVIPDVKQLDLGGLHRSVREALAKLDREGPCPSTASTFALLLVDGLSLVEERLASTLHTALAGVPLVGGSAADDLAFQETSVLVDGSFRSGAATLTIVRTTRSVETLQFQHFRAGKAKLVVTEAVPAERRVLELDAEPAAIAYAQHVGVERSSLNPAVFSRHPLVVRIAGRDCIRSVLRANDDNSLSFYCAIDEGLVLSIGERGRLIAELETELEAAELALGGVEAVLGFDCILRQLEARAANLVPELSRVLQRFGVVGFATYGEQIAGLHVNQTFTGVAIGRAPAPAPPAAAVPHGS